MDKVKQAVREFLDENPKLDMSKQADIKKAWQVGDKAWREHELQNGGLPPILYSFESDVAADYVQSNSPRLK